jgi:hypothetical protein
LLVSFSDYLRWCESEVLRAGLAGMQEAAQQPISFKRSYSIADQSTSPAGDLDIESNRDAGTNAAGAPGGPCKPVTPDREFR